MKINTNLIFEANKDNHEVLGYVELYRFIVEGQEESYENWLDLRLGKEENDLWAEKKFFERIIGEKNYHKMVTPVVTEDGLIVKWPESFALSYCLGEITFEGVVLGDLKIKEPIVEQIEDELDSLSC